MSRSLFLTPFIKLLLFLLLCCTLCASAGAGSSAGNNAANAELFGPGKINIVRRPSGGRNENVDGGITLKEVDFPFFFAAAKDSVMVAVAKASYTEKDSTNDNQRKVGVVAKFVETNNKSNWGKDVIGDVNTKWRTQLATENNVAADVFSTIKAFAVNADGDKIYIFLLEITSKDSAQQWNLKLFEGTVSGEKNGKTIQWKRELSTELHSDGKFKKMLQNRKMNFFMADGSAFLIEDKRIGLVVKGICEKNGEKDVTVFLQFEKAENNLRLLHVESFAGWYSFFQWEEKIFRAPTDDLYGDSNTKNVMVFDARQNKFTKSEGSLAYLRGFLKDKNNFATALIKERRVLLLIQKKQNGGITDAKLWISDGGRVGYAGDIVTNIEDTLYVSILHTNDELFALRQIHNVGDDSAEGNNKVLLTRLQNQLDNITATLDAWKQGDGIIEQLYNNPVSAKALLSTDGLVGFLHNTTDNKTNEWKDEYFYTNATIKKEGKAEKVPNGLEFGGEGAGAMWPVGKQQEDDQPYSFKDLGFTLVATVTVGSGTNSSHHNSILGVGLRNRKNIGLWCTADGNWGVSAEDGQKIIHPSAAACERGESYYVAVVLDGSKKLSVYVDGEQLTDLTNKAIRITNTQDIAHFYFGADRQQAKTDVTITNVLLYNRPFTAEELMALKEIKNVAGLSTEDGAARVGVVGVLCFMLFGVFTLLGRYVY